MTTITPHQIRTMHALGISRRDISDLLGPRCQSCISACLRARTAPVYRAKGILRYVSTGHRVE